jgi:hypothetical protein
MQIIVAGSSNWLSGESNRLKHCSTCFAGWKVSEITLRKIEQLNAMGLQKGRWWRMSDKIQLFATGFVQVFFVAINTYFIANRYYGGVLVCGFIISIIWSWNVKKVAFGSIKDRLFYSAGAGLGSICGLMVSVLILK